MSFSLISCRFIEHGVEGRRLEEYRKEALDEKAEFQQSMQNEYEQLQEPDINKLSDALSTLKKSG